MENIKNILIGLYGNDPTILEYQIKRYEKLIKKFKLKFNEKSFGIFSSPGRIEIGGNHTDHNNGKVLAASINLDSVAVASKTDNGIITVYSEGYENPFVADCKKLDKNISEEGTTTALIKGIAARFLESNYNAGGFNAYITSDVLPGSGLSSSASIEVLIGTILNNFYNDNKITPVEIAKAGQYAENFYFGKPCGLMDQTACAVGGILSIDFKDPGKPKIEKVNCDFSKAGYDIIVVDTGGNHADLTDDYASIPTEMKAVAKYFGKQVCREITLQQIFGNFNTLRKEVGDRAVLRAIHFLNENETVTGQIEALRKKKLKEFFSLVSASGNSSFKWLQNVYSNRNVKEQGIGIALAITENFIQQIGEGACRVHGGGFAGTILAFIPKESAEEYIRLISQLFGKGKAKVLSIRNTGGRKIYSQ